MNPGHDEESKNALDKTHDDLEHCWLRKMFVMGLTPNI